MVAGPLVYLYLLPHLYPQISSLYLYLVLNIYRIKQAKALEGMKIQKLKSPKIQNMLQSNRAASDGTKDRFSVDDWHCLVQWSHMRCNLWAYIYAHRLHLIWLHCTRQCQSSTENRSFVPSEAALFDCSIFWILGDFSFWIFIPSNAFACLILYMLRTRYK